MGLNNENSTESYTDKHQDQIACSYGYKLVYVDDKFVQKHKSENTVYIFLVTWLKTLSIVKKL